MTKRSFQDFLIRLEANGLLEDMKKRCAKARVSLLELYEGPIKAPSIVAARRSVYLWLLKEGKGINEIARLFDRAPNGVVKMTRGGR
jgi:hypothetical protein